MTGKEKRKREEKKKKEKKNLSRWIYPVGGGLDSEYHRPFVRLNNVYLIEGEGKKKKRK